MAAGLGQYVTSKQAVVVRVTTRISQGALVGVDGVLTAARIPAGSVVTPFSQLDAYGARA